MRLENSFEVAAPREEVWSLLMDVPRIVPCMPGAELSEVVDDRTWKAKMNVKLGPIALTFAADVTREEVDEAGGRVRLATQAREIRGRGAAQATIESSVSPADGATRVDIVTDIALSGPVAQYGRGVIQDVSSQLVTRFAECLESLLAPAAAAGEDVEPQAAQPRPVKPLGGFSLLFGALGRRIARLFRRN